MNNRNETLANTSRDRQEQVTQSRRERLPFGVPRQKLPVDKETQARYKGSVLRWINDVDTRLQDALNGGYEFVKGSVQIGDARENVNDSRVSRVVDKDKAGRPIRAYLMAISKEWYEEDQQAKEEINKKVDDAIRGGQPTGLQSHGINPSLGGTSVKKVQYQP